MALTDELSCDEKKAVEELQLCIKNEFPPQMTEDITLLWRFLKARNFDVNKAAHMLRNNIKWRKSFQMHTILEDFKPKKYFLKYNMPSYIGLDKEGDMVHFIPLGKLEIREILKCTTLNEYMKHWAWFCETSFATAKQRYQKTGRFPQLTLLLDLENLTLSNATNKQAAEICLRLTHLLLDNYPECLKSAYVFNAPGYYVFLFSIMKALMSHDMVKKICVYGQYGWKEKLTELIDPDILPGFLGGSNTDIDKNFLCTTYQETTQDILAEYYLPEEERWFKDKSKVKKVSIPSKSKEEISVDVAERDSLIHWEFLVNGKDIGFGLFYKEQEKDEEEILPIQRIDTIDGTEKGCYKVHSIGKYIIVFDNSHSWITSKEIEYCIAVLRSGS